MSPLLWVLFGFVIFWLGAAALRSRGLLPASVVVHGPMVTWHTRRGRNLLNRLAAPRRLWRAWGNFGLGIALVVMVGALVFFVLAAVLTIQQPPSRSAITQPRNSLVIPGVNEFLPLSVAPEIVAGLAVALVVHEGGHGILCRVEDIEIESLGLLFLAILPAGAFVEPDEESQERASRGARSRMFAAGVTNNFAITALAFALLFGPVVGSLAVAPGAAVAGALPGSPATDADIGKGDRIVRVGNESVTSNDDLGEALRRTDGRSTEVELASGRTATVSRTVYVTGAVAGDWPADVERNTTITGVNGTAVHTTPELEDAVGNATTATLSTGDGRTVTLPIGAYVTVQPDGPFNDSGAPVGSFVVTRFDGDRVRNADDLERLLAGTRPDQTVSVVAHSQSGRAEYDVRLGEHPRGENGFLGVLIAPGFSGLELSDFGVETYPAGRYLAALGGSCEGCPSFGFSFVDRIYLALQFPVVGLTGSAAFPFNFAGFTGGVANFYTVTGPLAALGGAAFVLANLLFWTAWINLNLAFFNCIPTFLLDGGHIFRTAVESVAARLPVSDRHRLVSAATLSVQFVMLGSLFLLLFGAQLFG